MFLIHPATKKAYERVISELPHALIVLGEAGAGKTFLSENLASEILKTVKLHSYPYFHIFPSDEAAGIDQVREIKRFLSLKTTGTGIVRRIVIIDGADNLGQEAQNALLKILEEPPLDSMIILTAADKNRLLKTVISRSQILKIMPLAKEHTIKSAARADKKNLEAYYLMSGGSPGLFASLIEKQKDHPLTQAVSEAKKLISSSIFERLTMINDLAKDKTALLSLLDAMQRVLTASFNQSAMQGNKPAAKRLSKAQTSVITAKLDLHRNINTKLVLTNLFLNI